MALQILPVWLQILLLSSVVYFYIKASTWKGRKTQLPPGPPRLPIIGNLHQLGKIPHQSLWKLSKQYGPVMYLQLGGAPTLVVSSPEAAKHVLKVHDLNCCSRPALIGPGKLSYNFIDIAFSPFGDYWREIRKVCVLELFSPRRVDSFRSIREEEVGLMIDSISRSCSSAGRSVDLSEKVQSFTATIVYRVAFGQSFQGSKFGNRSLRQVSEDASAMLGCFCAADFFPYAGRIVDILTGLRARLDRSFRELDGIYQKAIDEHINKEISKRGQEDIIDFLLKIGREKAESGGGHQITEDHIKAILMNIFTAGIDSSAVTVIWAMSELMRNPRTLKKAQVEVRSLIGNKGKVNEEDLQHFDYLKLVVKETLRLHPPGPLLLPRETISPFEINGYLILPKTRIYVNVWAIGRDPSVWNEPEKFVPERFEGTSIDLRGQQQFELLPFGGGRRGCPGMYMGLATANLALANLLYHFEWNLPDEMKVEDLNMEECAGLTLLKKHPLNLVPFKHY